MGLQFELYTGILATSLVTLFMCLPEICLASPVYTCSSWPGGTLEAALIVDCPDDVLGTFKTIPHEVWRGPKYLIDISRNGLTGSLNFSAPSSSIRSIVVSENDLSGTLPTSLPSSIRDLDLSGNAFSDSLPSGWSSAIALRSIRLKDNAGISGTLPVAWSVLTRLEVLDLRGTDVGGEIPSAYLQLTRLSSLLVDGCNFTGCVPLGIPFPVPSLQKGGFLLEQCTAAPTTSPTMSPTTSKPSFAPTASPSVSPTRMPTVPTFTPTILFTQTTSSPTLVQSTGAATQQDVGLAVGIGIGVTVVVLVALGGTYIFWMQQHRGTRKKTVAESVVASPKDDGGGGDDNEGGPAPLPSGPRPGRTFIPGKGWVQDQSSGPRMEPAPPPLPKN